MLSGGTGEAISGGIRRYLISSIVVRYRLYCLMPSMVISASFGNTAVLELAYEYISRYLRSCMRLWGGPLKLCIR